MNDGNIVKGVIDSGSGIDKIGVVYIGFDFGDLVLY